MSNKRKKQAKGMTIVFSAIMAAGITCMCLAGRDMPTNVKAYSAEPMRNVVSEASCDYGQEGIVKSTTYEISAVNTKLASRGKIVGLDTYSEVEPVSEDAFVGDIVEGVISSETSETMTQEEVKENKVPAWNEVEYGSDLYYLSKLIMGESEGEPYEGKVAVGNVVMNRVNSSLFPDTVKDVIYQKFNGTWQFSVCGGNRRIDLTPNADSIRAAYDVLYNGAKADGMTDNVLYFNTFGKWWKGVVLWKWIGGHAFAKQVG